MIGAVSSPNRLPLDLNAAFNRSLRLELTSKKEAVHEHDSSHNSSFGPSSPRSRLSGSFLTAYILKSLLHDGVTDHVETYTTVLHRRSRASQKAASLEPHGRKDSDIRKQVAQTCARNVMVHSAMAFLADDKTLGVLGPSIPLIPATKQVSGSLTSDSLEVCFLPLTYSGSPCRGLPLSRMIFVWINIPSQLGFISQRIRSRDTQATWILPHPHMMINALGNGDDCRKALSSSESGNIDYWVGAQSN